MPQFTAHQGNIVGQSDDETVIVADSVDDAMRKALGWAESGWPESDGGYAAVVWIEDEGGNILASEDVDIGPDGELQSRRGPQHR